MCFILGWFSYVLNNSPVIIMWSLCNSSWATVWPSPQFSAHTCCGEMAGLIKMPLGIGPGDFVLDGDPAPFPKRGPKTTIFGPCPVWPNGWMDYDATWYAGRPRLKRHCVRWGPSSPFPQKGQSPPNFRPMSIVAKRLDGSRLNLSC